MADPLAICRGSCGIWNRQLCRFFKGLAAASIHQSFWYSLCSPLCPQGCHTTARSRVTSWTHAIANRCFASLRADLRHVRRVSDSSIRTDLRCASTTRPFLLTCELRIGRLPTRHPHLDQFTGSLMYNPWSKPCAVFGCYTGD